MRLPIPLVVLLACFTAAASGVSHAGSPSGSLSDWLPFSVGSVKNYAGHWDRTYQPSNGPRERSFSRGWIQQRVVAKEPGAERSGPVFRVSEQILQQRLDGSGEDRARRENYFSLGADGAVARFGDAGSPVRILPAALEKGARWSAGTLRIEEVEIELSGEVLGYGDVDLSGEVLPRCLHVRISGTPRGWTQLPIGRGQVTGGRYEMDLWFAEAIGIVKARTRSDFELEFEEGEAPGKALSSSVMTRRLDRSSLAP